MVIHYFLLIALFILLAIGKNVLTSVGLPFQFAEYIAFYISLFVVITDARTLVFGRQRREMAMLLFFLLLLSFYLMALTKENIGLVRLYIIPPLVCTGLPVIYKYNTKIHNRFWHYAFMIVIICFFWEALLAITERILEYNFFKWKASDGEIDFISSDIRLFRSAALYGHPLYNALMISIAMAFILISPLKPIIKYSLWVIGYFAILSCNTRGAMIANPVFLLIYIIYILFAKNNIKLSKRIGRVWLIGLSFPLVIYLISNFEFGYRLFYLGLMDDYGSTQARMDTWKIIFDLTWSDILWGISSSQKHFLLYHHNFITIENCWIEMIFQIGLVFFLILIFLYYRLVRKLLSAYGKFEAVFVTISFLGIASMNNSLGSNSLALLYFLVLCCVFDPRLSTIVIPRQYIQTNKSKIILIKNLKK